MRRFLLFLFLHVPFFFSMKGEKKKRGKRGRRLFSRLFHTGHPFSNRPQEGRRKEKKGKNEKKKNPPPSSIFSTARLYQCRR